MPRSLSSRSRNAAVLLCIALLSVTALAGCSSSSRKPTKANFKAAIVKYESTQPCFSLHPWVGAKVTKYEGKPVIQIVSYEDAKRVRVLQDAGLLGKVITTKPHKGSIMEDVYYPITAKGEKLLSGKSNPSGPMFNIGQTVVGKIVKVSRPIRVWGMKGRYVKFEWSSKGLPSWVTPDVLKAFDLSTSGQASVAVALTKQGWKVTHL